VNEKAAKGVFFFLLSMLFFTFVSWKLDVLRTPRVLCLEAGGGYVGDESYPMVLPKEAVSGGVWVVGETQSAFYPFTARRVWTTEKASDEHWSAVDGVAVQSQVVWYTNRALSGGTVPVRLWEEEVLDGRVEVLCAAEGEEVLREAALRFGRAWDVSREGDRLVIEGVDLYTAQQAGTALWQAGLEAYVLDYAWGPAVTAQSGKLWMGWGAVLALIVLGSLVWDQGKRELDRARESLEHCYPGAYLAEAGVRLLAKAIGLAAAAFAAAVLLRWLWNAPVELPAGFLPEGSIFDWEHYRQWTAAAFPEGMLSAYGAALAEELRRGHLIAAAECIGLTALAVLLMKVIKFRK